jgi:hypothetical protein
MGRTTPTVRQILESTGSRILHSGLLSDEEKTLLEYILMLGRKHSDSIAVSGVNPETGLLLFALMEILRRFPIDGE